MKNILIITYYWPPGAGPGVQRWLKFTKFLPDHGLQPFVLTVKHGSYPNTDPSLQDDVHPGIQVIKTRSIEPFRLYNLLRGKSGKQIQVGMPEMREPKSLLQKLANYIRANWFIPDARKGWNITNYPAAVNLISKHNIDTVITTGPPHSTHLTGLKLKQKLDIHWIADFRDPWTTIYYNAYLGRTQKSISKDQKLEDAVLHSADAVTVISPQMQREFAGRAKTVEVIFNGYDPEDIPPKQVAKTSRFILAYVGSLKESQQLSTLFEVIWELAASDPGFKEDFRLSITGNIAPAIREQIRNANLGSMCLTEPYVPHKEATLRMVNANLLLLPIPYSKNNKGILTGKIFEYLSSRTPILAIGPVNGDAAQILVETGRSPMIDYHDNEGMKRFIGSRYAKWKAGDGVSEVVQNDQHMKFTRQEQTGVLVDLINRVQQS